MANVFVDDRSLTAIGNAIRTKLCVETKYLPSAMAEAVLSIPTGGESNSEHGVIDVSYGRSVTIPKTKSGIPSHVILLKSDLSAIGANCDGMIYIVETDVLLFSNVTSNGIEVFNVTNDGSKYVTIDENSITMNTVYNYRPFNDGTYNYVICY